MAGFEKLRGEFETEGVSLYAGVAQPVEQAREVQEGLSFPVAYDVTREHADSLGAWWDGKRDFIQPSEFIINRKGVVLSATYSSGPIGRVEPQDALSLVKILKARSKRS